MSDVSSDEGLQQIADADVIGADSWLRTRLDHPEDVAVANDGTLYAGGEAGQLYRVNPADDTVAELANTGGFVLGVTIGPDGDLYACDFQQHAVFRLPLNTAGTPAGELETVVSGGPQSPPRHPNYCVFDRDGRLYVSDSGDREDMAAAGGCIYAVDRDGTERVVTESPSAFPNGLALGRSGDTLYVAETGTHTVSAIHLDDGRADETVVVTDGFGVIDGLALDAADRLYGASIGDNAVYRLDDDEVELVIRDPEGLTIGNPTNVAFGGPDMQTLYIANLGLWHITAIDVDAPGRRPTARL